MEIYCRDVILSAHIHISISFFFSGIFKIIKRAVVSAAEFKIKYKNDERTGKLFEINSFLFAVIHCSFNGNDIVAKVTPCV